MTRQFNPAKSTSFVFTVSNRRDLSLKIQSSSVGSVNLGSAPFPSRWVDMNVPGNKLDYGPMTMRVLVSEDLHEWVDLYKWMIEITQTNDAHLSQVEHGELTILNSENIPVLRFIYKGVYPLTLGDLQYSLVEDETTLVCDLTVDFSSFDIHNLVSGERVEYGSGQD